MVIHGWEGKGNMGDRIIMKASRLCSQFTCIQILQICIAFHLHLDTAVIPKSVTPSRIIENLEATEIKLDAEDMRSLRELDRNVRYVSVSIPSEKMTSSHISMLAGKIFYLQGVG